MVKIFVGRFANTIAKLNLIFNYAKFRSRIASCYVEPQSRIFLHKYLEIKPKRLYLCPRLTKKSLINKMKKLFTFAAIAGFLSLAACGPSQEELDKQKRIKDSLAQDSMDKIAKAQHEADSIKQAHMADSLHQIHIQDSLRMDSMEKASKKTGGTKPKPKTVTEPPKSTEGAPKVGNKKPGAK